MQELMFRVEDLSTTAERESAQALASYRVRQSRAFEIGVHSPMTDNGTLIYVLSGRTHPDGITQLVESYYPAHPPRDNTWMYADVKPGKAPVVRSYTFESPATAAGWVYSRMDSFFTELTHRYPDYVKASDHER